MVMGGVSATAGASAAGLPYAGVPEEMRARVEDLVRSEPAREPSRIVFQQRPGRYPGSRSPAWSAATGGPRLRPSASWWSRPSACRSALC